ncbi:MAG: hypothetical protein Q7R88_02615, partial [bacterium]|nr:hypothetical protein [bacterium]
AFKTQLAPYIPSVPKDPLDNSAARYYGAYRMTWSPGAVCDGFYVLWAYVENANSTNTCGWAANHYFKVLGRF